MRILGITDGQTSGAAIIDDGRIIAAINEERIARIKLARGFPWQSISEVLKLSNTHPREISAVGVGQINMELTEQVKDWPGWFEARESDYNLHSRFFKVAARFGGIAPKIPGLQWAYYAARTPAYAHRRRRIKQILREEYGIQAQVQFVHHHYAHAASAYFTSNFDDALVVSMDGGGDRHSSHIYSVRNAKFERVNAADTYDSLGNYYAYTTAICGFKAKRHEGKITGLAARGKPIYRELLESMIGCENGRLVNRAHVLFNEALKQIRKRLPDGWAREDLAASIQVVAENVASDYIRYWVKKTGHRNVALAGGIFANVRINEEIHLIPEIQQTFVQPGMSDEGLAVGAALVSFGEQVCREGRRYELQPLRTVFFGNESETYFNTAKVQRKRPGTIQNEQQAIAHWQSHLGHVRIDKIATPMVASFVEKQLRGTVR